MVMGAVRVLCELSLPVSQQNHIDLFLAALDNVLKWFLKKKCAIGDQKMWKSAKAKVDELLAREPDHWPEQKIHTIRATMEL